MDFDTIILLIGLFVLIGEFARKVDKQEAQKAREGALVEDYWAMSEGAKEQLRENLAIIVEETEGMSQAMGVVEDFATKKAEKSLKKIILKDAK